MVENQADCNHLSRDDAKRLLASQAIYAWFYEGDYGPEHSAVALVQASNGEYGVFNESEDSTGHGCQCNADVAWFSTLDEAIEKGLSVDERNYFLRELKEQRG